MAKRVPKIQYQWRWDGEDFRVYWSLIGGNGEIMCQSSQGSQDKTDARRSVLEVARVLSKDSFGGVNDLPETLREVGPGRKS